MQSNGGRDTGLCGRYQRKKSELKGKLVRVEAQKFELTARENLWREATAQHEQALQAEKVQWMP